MPVAATKTPKHKQSTRKPTKAMTHQGRSGSTGGEAGERNYPGKKGRAICEKDGLVDMTFAYRDVTFSDGMGVAKGILVGVCDKCGEVIATPPESSKAIKKARSKALNTAKTHAKFQELKFEARGGYEIVKGKPTWPHYLMLDLPRDEAFDLALRLLNQLKEEDSKWVTVYVPGKLG